MWMFTSDKYLVKKSRMQNNKIVILEENEQILKEGVNNSDNIVLQKNNKKPVLVISKQDNKFQIVDKEIDEKLETLRYEDNKLIPKNNDYYIEKKKTNFLISKIRSTTVAKIVKNNNKEGEIKRTGLFNKKYTLNENSGIDDRVLLASTIILYKWF